jgi:thiosulfate dehydrogenase [quinone] large subunit
MSDILHPTVWSPEFRRKHPLRFTAILLVLLLRYLYAAVFLYGFYHKLTRHWMGSPTLRQHFLERLSEIDSESFSAVYLRHFAIPCFLPVAWVLTVGQFIVGTCLMLGLAVRPAGWLSLFLISNITAGSYYNASMPPFFAVALLLISTPSGRWLGLDAALSRSQATQTAGQVS